MSARHLGPLGFLLLMIGFGLRLDATWQWTADVLLLAGAVVSWTAWRAGRAFVRGPNGQ